MCFVLKIFGTVYQLELFWGSSWWVCLFLSSTSAVRIRTIKFPNKICLPTESMWSSLKKRLSPYIVRFDCRLAEWKYGNIIWGLASKYAAGYPSLKLSWQWKITMFDRRYIFRWVVFPLSCQSSGVHAFELPLHLTAKRRDVDRVWSLNFPSSTTGYNWKMTSYFFRSLKSPLLPFGPSPVAVLEFV